MLEQSLTSRTGLRGSTALVVGVVSSGAYLT